LWYLKVWSNCMFTTNITSEHFSVAFVDLCKIYVSYCTLKCFLQKSLKSLNLQFTTGTESNRRQQKKIWCLLLRILNILAKKKLL
jgi:hypothetical protein